MTSRHIRDRLQRELESNVALKVMETDQKDSFEVSGRGLLHLSVLIEAMRREGYELSVGKPEVIRKQIDGQVARAVRTSGSRSSGRRTSAR